MITLALSDGARMLGIHPKTLQHWLTQANLPLAAHPRDGRIKCLSMEHVEQLAALHRRPLQSPGAIPPALDCSLGQTTLPCEREAAHVQATPSSPTLLPQPPDLIQKLSCLETQVATLQEHMTQLVLALLQERDRNVERRITILETVAAELVGKPISPSPLPTPETSLPGKERPGAMTRTLRLNPAEHHVRSHLPPLVEYTASGTYVIISSLEGELSFSPDSSAWFEWLATISSFRFLGKQGRFPAYREAKNRVPTRSWVAYRLVHTRQRRSWLGVTDRLTIASLEQAAARLQGYVDAL
jgi:hypothetical protein